MDSSTRFVTAKIATIALLCVQPATKQLVSNKYSKVLPIHRIVGKCDTIWWYIRNTTPGCIRSMQVILSTSNSVILPPGSEILYCWGLAILSLQVCAYRTALPTAEVLRLYTRPADVELWSPPTLHTPGRCRTVKSSNSTHARPMSNCEVLRLYTRPADVELWSPPTLHTPGRCRTVKSSDSTHARPMSNCEVLRLYTRPADVELWSPPWHDVVASEFTC